MNILVYTKLNNTVFYELKRFNRKWITNCGLSYLFSNEFVFKCWLLSIAGCKTLRLKNNTKFSDFSITSIENIKTVI